LENDMPALADLVVNLTAETAAFTRKLDEAHRDAKKFADGVTTQFGALKAAGQAWIGALAIDKISDWVKGMAEVEERVGKMSQMYGVAVGTLSAWTYAAKISDVATEDLAKAMGTLAKAADEGNPAFKRLGVATRDSSGQLRPMGDIMLDVADRLSKLQDGTGKTAIALDLFGKSGATLIPFLDQGREGISQLIDEAARLGVVLDANAVAAAEKFNDNLKRLSSATEGLGRKLVDPLLPALTQVVEKLVEGASDPDRIDIFKILAKSAEYATKAFLTLFGAVQTGFDQLGATIKWLNAAAVNAITGDFSGAKAALDMGAGENMNIWREFTAGTSKLWNPPLAVSHGKDTRPPAPPSPPKDYTADLQRFLSEINSLHVEVAKATDNVIAEIHAKWEERRAKLKEAFEKLPATAKDAAAAYRRALGEIFAGERGDINKQLEELPELLEKANKAVAEWAKNQPLPNLGTPGAAMPQLKTDMFGANLDRFLADLEGQNKLAEEVMQGALTQAQRYNLELAKLDTLLAKGAISQDAYNRAVGSLRDRLDVNAMAMRDFSNAVIDNMKQSLLYSGDWHNALKAILADLAEMILRMTILKQLNTAGGGSGGGWLGALSQGLGALFGKIFAPLSTAVGNLPTNLPTGLSPILTSGLGPVPLPPLPGRAIGGDVIAGRAYMVGEHGPEPFIPGVSGTILPNSALRGGAPNVSVNVINQGSAKDARVGQTKWDRQMKQFVVDVVLDDVKNYGPLHGVIKGR
jgi:hypothetical protein